MPVSALALPYRKRRAPVSLSGYTPVDYVLEEVTHTSVSDGLRIPLDHPVALKKLLSHCAHGNEPCTSCEIDERCVTSPAERILVLELGSIIEKSLSVKILKNERICVLYEYTCVRSLLSKVTPCINKLDHRKIIISSYPRVILTESGSDVNDTGTVFHRYVVITNCEMCFLILSRRFLAGALEQRLISLALKISALVLLKYLISSNSLIRLSKLT